MKYIDGTEIKVGDVFSDGTKGREDVRLKNRAKVLYVDKYTLVWFPLNEFTAHSNFVNKYVSNTWCLSAEPKKIELSQLTKKELDKYNNSDKFLKTVDSVTEQR